MRPAQPSRLPDVGLGGNVIRVTITSQRAKAARARITSQGQITVPKAVRSALDLSPGDELEFEIVEGGAMLHPRRRTSILDFAGIAGDRSPLLPRTARELDEVLRAANAGRAARRHRR